MQQCCRQLFWFSYQKSQPLCPTKPAAKGPCLLGVGVHDFPVSQDTEYHGAIS